MTEGAKLAMKNTAKRFNNNEGNIINPNFKQNPLSLPKDGYMGLKFIITPSDAKNYLKLIRYSVCKPQIYDTVELASNIVSRIKETENSEMLIKPVILVNNELYF